jgi:hypothetical protein
MFFFEPLSTMMNFLVFRLTRALIVRR